MSPGVSAGPAACVGRTNNTIEKLLECVTVDGVRQHLAAFQASADANGGTRAAGTGGYDDSVQYVTDTLEAAGYTVTLDEFDFQFTPPAVLQQVAPIAATYETGAFTGTGYGTVTAAVTGVDLNLAPPRDPVTSGCEAADFAGFPAGHIALLQRGTCTYAVKTLNAEAAGASAVIIFNQGNTPLREGLIVGTLLPSAVTIPVVGASFADGVALSQPGSTALVDVDPPESRPQVNVIAELPGRTDDKVVMLGAHLDSVQAGPGIQDKKISLYLNFDMIASPNYVYFIYDGNDSDGVGAGPGPAGSAQIEALFESFYRSRGLPFKGTDFSGRSDYGPFIAEGIPAGGLFTGAEGVKTPEEAALWGGTAGVSYDPCYHLACDTIANVNNQALDVDSDAAATAVLTYAMNLQSIGGKRGKGNFAPPRLDPAATSLPTS